MTGNESHHHGFPGIGQIGNFPGDARSAADLYIKWGLAPIPLPYKSKNPGYPNWQKLNVTPDNLDAYFPSNTKLNIGILNGAPSNNHVDVDLDCFEARLVASSLLPDTGWIFGRETAPNSHWIFKSESPVSQSSLKYCDVDGATLIELRGTGGHTVFPPSSHNDTGEIITWERLDQPGKVLLADLKTSVAEVAAVSILARHWPGKGGRQDTYLALVGGFIRAGWTSEKIEQFVKALASATRDDEVRKRLGILEATAIKCADNRKTTGWPTLAKLLVIDGDKVVRRVLEWLGIRPTSNGKGATARRIRLIPPYIPFPVAALPRPLLGYVTQGAAALGCDPAFLALPVLTAIASVIGNTRRISLKRGWSEPLVIWAAVVADSGTLKTPAWKKAFDYLFRMQKHLRDEHKKAIIQYQQELEEYKDAKKKARSEGGDPGLPPEMPVLRRVIVNDTTIERLAQILEENPRGALVARDELAGWFASLTRYKGTAGGSDLAGYLELWQAGTLMVDRKTGDPDRRTIIVALAAACISGCIQPGVLANALTREFMDSGGAARILLAAPPKHRKQWSDVDVPPEVVTAYEALIDKLFNLEFDAQNDQSPHFLGLSPDGLKAWIVFYNRFASEQHAVEGELAAAYSKAEAYAARFALLHHVVSHVNVDNSDLRPIGPRSVEAGCTLAAWFANEARRIYATLTESKDELQLRRLVEFIRSHGGSITVKKLQQSNSRNYPTSEDAEIALQALVTDGLAEWHERPSTAKGGRPTRDCVLIPLRASDETDETPPSGGEADDPSTNVVEDGTASEHQIPNESGGLVGNVDGLTEETLPEDSDPYPKSASAHAEVSSESNVGYEEYAHLNMPYLLVADETGLGTVAAALAGSELVAVDVETTGLDPRKDRVRLLSLAIKNADGGTSSFLIDVFAVNPSPVWGVLADLELILHDGIFDLAFLERLGFTPRGNVNDTMLLAQLLVAGTMDKVSLAACCKRWLGLDLDKSEQRSDWSGQLTVEQLKYAALDTKLLFPLLKTLNATIHDAGLDDAAQIERRCLPAVAWLGQQGVLIDQDAWRTLAHPASLETDRVREELDAMAPKRPGEQVSVWNWKSPKQALEALRLAGCKLKSTADEVLASVDHPLAQLLRRYRQAQKMSSTYGDTWLANVANDGRVYPNWKQIGTVTGRMSCSEPNMQQIPRGEHRRCIVAPPGRVLIKADYSQIELRIAAKISGDQALLEAYERGDDLHTLTARSVLGIEEVTKDHRQLAKALNFGNLFGMGPTGFRQYAKATYGLDLSFADAKRYQNAFFKNHPGLAAWHRCVRLRSSTETRTLSGRRRLLDSRTPDTERLNTPVQGAGADGMKLALALLYERRFQAPGANPVLVAHDEIVVEADADQAEAVSEWLRSAMVEGMALLIAPVPVEVEVTVGRTWDKQ
jgi:DNA polymerase I-like protein with 3'-5' exonuclease and polymerase domains